MPTKEQGKKFKEHLVENGISLSSTVDFINDNMKPEDVFDHIHLHQWAQQNGYAKPMVRTEELSEV